MDEFCGFQKDDWIEISNSKWFSGEHCGRMFFTAETFVTVVRMDKKTWEMTPNVTFPVRMFSLEEFKNLVTSGFVTKIEPSLENS